MLGTSDEEADAAGDADAAGEPAGVFVVTDADGEHRLTLFHEAEEDDYSLTSDRVAGRFEVATYIAEQMLADPADLQADAAEAQDNVLEEGAVSDQEG